MPLADNSQEGYTDARITCRFEMREIIRNDASFQGLKQVRFTYIQNMIQFAASNCLETQEEEE